MGACVLTTTFRTRGEGIRRVEGIQQWVGHVALVVEVKRPAGVGGVIRIDGPNPHFEFGENRVRTSGSSGARTQVRRLQNSGFPETSSMRSRRPSASMPSVHAPKEMVSGSVAAALGSNAGSEVLAYASDNTMRR